MKLQQKPRPKLTKNIENFIIGIFDLIQQPDQSGIYFQVCQVFVKAFIDNPYMKYQKSKTEWK